VAGAGQHRPERPPASLGNGCSIALHGKEIVNSRRASLLLDGLDARVPTNGGIARIETRPSLTSAALRHDGVVVLGPKLVAKLGQRLLGRLHCADSTFHLVEE
jgi:hypothetical protein